MFNIPTVTVQTQAELLASSQMSRTNQRILELENCFKADWVEFWDISLPVDVMQAKIDFLATQSATDQGIQTNALTAYFNKALRVITYLRGENPSAFSDATIEMTGATQPSGGPYMRYVSPGWVYSYAPIDPNQPLSPTNMRFVVSVPCQF